MAKRRKVTVTRADGTTEVVGPGHFKKRQKKPATSRYGRYLKTPHWRRVRREILERDGHRCAVCASRYRVQVHHRTYERLGQELADDLVTLCEACHRKTHQLFTGV